MGLLKTTAVTLTLAGAALYASHRIQLELIENEARTSMITKKNAGNVFEDIQAIHRAVRNRIHRYGGTYEFIAGDFDVRNGEARCGGIAALACFEGAERGFYPSIKFEMKGLRCHYYALLERNNETFRFELTLPPTQTKIPDASRTNTGKYLASTRGK